MHEIRTVVLFLLSSFLDSGSVAQSSSGSSAAFDERGYVFYCPCHGRFGNQADQFLGSIAFAKELNRTLILPPWRTYSRENKMVPFDRIFQAEPLRDYHRVILAEDFMRRFGASRWPLEKRIAFCYLPEHKTENTICTTESEFFAEFWKFVGVPQFVSMKNIRGLRYDGEGAQQWKERYSATEYPVIALKGPPAPFPVPLHQWPLQNYLKWADPIQEEGDAFISSKFANQSFIGIHLRNGIDWVKACDLIKDDRHGLRNLMASTQCLGEAPENKVTMSMCLPDKKEVMEKILEIVHSTGLERIFVATDDDPYQEEFSQVFPEGQVERLLPDDPMVDLYILGKSEVFIGNCVSSFSSFVRRQREVEGKRTVYYGIPVEGDARDEL